MNACEYGWYAATLIIAGCVLYLVALIVVRLLSWFIAMAPIIDTKMERYFTMDTRPYEVGDFMLVNGDLWVIDNIRSRTLLNAHPASNWQRLKFWVRSTWDALVEWIAPNKENW